MTKKKRKKRKTKHTIKDNVPCGNHSCEECYPELVEVEYEIPVMDKVKSKKVKGDKHEVL